MTATEYARLLEYVYHFNGWNSMVETLPITGDRRRFKYVNASFDTRDGHIWKIELYLGGNTPHETFIIKDKSDIDAIYAYLDGE